MTNIRNLLAVSPPNRYPIINRDEADFNPFAGFTPEQIAHARAENNAARPLVKLASDNGRGGRWDHAIDHNGNFDDDGE